MISQEIKVDWGSKGFNFFLAFLFVISLSQLLFEFSKPLSLVFFAISLLVVVVVAFASSKVEMFFFMFFIILMNIVIPITGDRTFSQLLPPIFFFMILAKSRFDKDAKVSVILICLFFYFIMVLISVFYEIKIPTTTSGERDNTGLLARWNLLNTFFVFFAAFLSFRTEAFQFLVEKFYKLLLIILILSLIVFYWDISFKLPLFNSFSWSIIHEGSGSKRMGIAGVASTYLLIYLLSFKTKAKTNWLIFIMIILGVIASGGRSSMLAFFFIVYLNWVIERRILIRSFIISCIAVFAFILFSFSPLILVFPPGIQRVFIIFPREFYSGALKNLENSAAANSSTFRYTMWKMATPEIADHILLGKGFGVPRQTYSFSNDGMSTLQTKSNETLYYDFMAGGQLHNTYISIAYILGLPAMLLFLVAFFSLIRKTYRYYLEFSDSKFGPYLKFLLLILFSSFLSSLLGDLHFDLVFFIFFAITLRLLSAYSREEKPVTNFSH